MPNPILQEQKDEHLKQMETSGLYPLLTIGFNNVGALGIIYPEGVRPESLIEVLCQAITIVSKAKWPQ